MKITPVLKLATAFVAFTISAHSEVVFSFAAIDDDYPTAKSSAEFNAVDDDGNRTYPYPTYGNTDAGNGAGWGGAVVTNFDGTTPVANPGDQRESGIHTTTWMGPSFYAGINRDTVDFQAGAIHSHGNGFRIRVNDVGAGSIDAEGVGPTAKAVFMFDADTSILSGDGDNLIFGDSDTITAKVAVPAVMGPDNADRASAASYRAMVKANGEYYAGSLQTIDLSTVPASSTLTVDMSESCANTTWTLMPNMDGSDYDSIATNPAHPQNLTVDTSESATTVPGKFLTNITQVGFYLETTSKEQLGGYNYGVREFAAQATPASAPHPIEWSEDFTNPITFLTTTNNKVYDGDTLLTGYSHAYKWSTSNGGSGTTLTQGGDSVTLETTVNGSNGELSIHMIGPGTESAQRRVKPVSHETTFEIDLEGWKAGSADLMLTTRGQDGWVRSTIGPSGMIKWTTWMSDYTHKNFNNFSGETRLRNNTNNPGIVIEDGGTFDPNSDVPVTATISGNAVISSVNMTEDGTAVASVSLSNYGSGYTSEPTVTFSGGGMTVAPTVSFNFSTGNIGGGSHIKEYHLGKSDQDGDVQDWNVLKDGQILTYIQSYDNSDDSLSYYYSLTDKATGEITGPTYITTLTAADHSAGGVGYGFFDVSTGNRWGQPNNQDAVKISYKRYNNATAAASTVGIRSITVATSDGDRDGVIDRNDAFPADPFESADGDGDGVGDNSDAYPGLDDAVFTLIHTAAQTAGDTAFSTYVNDNADNYSYSVGGGDITQEAYNAVVAQRDAAQTALDNAPTLADVEQTVMDARAGSTRIDVSDGVASITLTLEETSAVSDWSSATTSEQTFQVNAPAGTSFYRFKIAD
ncbi:MAG: hypothetical protein VXZ83_04995 [Verrucomicrobiota bacterium]|nr:hypothetical protein [Verrucomicrobiota bacterium]